MSGDSIECARWVGTVIAPHQDMTIKNMFMLTGLLAGAAYLRDKGRRDRLVGKARGLIDQAKTRAGDLAHQVESKASQAASALDSTTSKDNGVSSGAGATTRSSTYDTFGTSRNYR
jgi:uncharacterized protein YjbJ (UPF0337 family)